MSYPKIRRGGGAAATGKCIRLEADLNLSAWDDTTIGGRTKEAPFTGHFDGNGHTLTYRVTGGTLSGLFPYVGRSGADPAVIKNLNCAVTQKAVTANAEDTVAYGALIRSAQNCEISAITVSQTFEGRAERAAGLAGALAADGVIKDCAVTAAAGKYYLYGGIAGFLSGRIENSRYALGEGASELERFGGVAVNMNGSVTGCSVSFPEAGVKAMTADPAANDGGRVGGVAMSMGSGSITGCRVVYNVTEANDAPYLGGIAGWLDADANAASKDAIRIEDCRVTGKSVRGGSMVGGMAGYIQRSFGRQYLFSGVEVEIGDIEASGSYAGGLVGRALADWDMKMTDCTANASVSVGNRYAGGLIGMVQYTGAGQDGRTYFTLENCHMYGTSVAARGQYPAYAGGAIGSVESVSTGTAYCRTSVADCSAAANVSGLGNIGGFIGNVTTAEQQLSDTEYQIRNCFAYGSAIATGVSHQAAGFLGHIISENLRVADCRAYGSAAVPRGAGSAGGTHAGGFIGYADKLGLVTRCEAFGDAEGGGGIAGFIGRLNAGTIKDCKSWGDTVCWWQSGGFVGWVSTASTHENNEAHGDVIAEAGGQYGGYAGCIYDIAGMDKNFYAKNCTAYGDVVDLVGGSSAGGFAGIVYTSVKAEFVGCSAYGDIPELADGSGGFVGSSYTVLATTQISYTDCAAYGNVAATRGGYSSAGGFCAMLGWGNFPGTHYFTNCKAYGSVAGYYSAGGILGMVSAKAIITGCGYYGPSVTNAPANDVVRGGLVGDLNAVNGGTSTGSVLTDNEFTALNRVFGRAAEGVAVTSSNNRYLGNIPANPKGMVSVAFSGAGNAFTVAFTGAAGYRMTELAVSTDGGKFYTQLVHSGKALVALTPQAAGQNPLSCQNFSYTYPMVSPGGIKVRITVTNGTRTVTRVF